MVGFELRRVQIGLEPRDWKPMLDIGLGVREIRIRTELQFRVLYVARYREAVYVLHAFEKRSTKTSRRDLELAKQRMRLLSAERSRQGG